MSSEPCTFIVFGATGHLSRNKLLPAMYHLEEAKRIPDNTSIIGFTRQKINDDDWNDQVNNILNKYARDGINNDVANQLHARMHMLSGDMTNPESLKTLKDYIDNNKSLSKNLIFYMAIPPNFYTRVSEALSKAGLTEEDQGWRRIVIEKLCWKLM